MREGSGGRPIEKYVGLRQPLISKNTITFRSKSGESEGEDKVSSPPPSPAVHLPCSQPLRERSAGEERAWERGRCVVSPLSLPTPECELSLFHKSSDIESEAGTYPSPLLPLRYPLNNKQFLD